MKKQLNRGILESCPTGAGLCPTVAGLCPTVAGLCPMGAGLCPKGAGLYPTGAGLHPGGARVVPRDAQLYPGDTTHGTHDLCTGHTSQTLGTSAVAVPRQEESYLQKKNSACE